ncbi:MAG: serine hydrolase [Acidobacteria bacterium]|nr:MAG: serine hydrolase [Acidobacteriota bacterium]
MSWSFSNPTARLLRNGSRHSERTENPMNLQHEKKTFLFENLSQQLLVMLAVAATLLCFPTLSWGQKPKVNPLTPNIPVAQKPEPAPSTARPMTESDIEAFLDGLVPLQLERDDIAGVAIAVVKDGKVLFAKGYGYSDVKKKTPVSVENTLFRPGSISKLFTWTAVMQLVEQGKLDLDRDVNDYLDFKIPPTYPQPITLRNIMTHTAGFGETAKDLFVPDAKDLTPLRPYLVEHMPKRIFPPGTTPAYSNYATTMAGYVVQRVSGKPFNDYINESILKPLGMQHTTFAQPLPPELKSLMSDGYQLASSPAGSFEVVQAWPAGSVSTSAMDMTRFIIAHLQDGQFNGARILKPETAELMHARQFAAHFFVSYNSAGKGEDSDRTALWEKFLDRYFPYTPPAESPVASAAQDARAVSALYMPSRRSQGNILEAVFMLGEVKVFTNADGTISADALKDFNGQAKKFQEISSLVYRDVNGQDRMAFKRDANGRLYFVMDFPFFTFQRVGWVQAKPFNYFVLGASVAILILALVLWPVAALVRRHYGRKLNLSPRQRRLRIAVRLVCVADLLFLGGLIGLLSLLDAPGAANSHIDIWIHLLQIVGVIGAVGTVLAIYSAVHAWRATSSPVRATVAAAGAADAGSTSAPASQTTESSWIWSKIFPTLIAVACIGITWFFVYWNLLNFNLNY